MKAEAYLKQIDDYKCRIDLKKEQKAMWMEIASGTTSNMNGERVQSSSKKNKMADATIEMVTLDEEIESLKAQIQEIIRTIESLETKYYEFLMKRYIQGMSYKELRAYYNKSSSWLGYLKQDALNELQRVLYAKEKV